ncbi:NapC/NirT cytochrome c family, N-terminal region, partial [endosymbiont of Ridgeia piscesae]
MAKNGGAGIEFRVTWQLTAFIFVGIVLFLLTAYGGVEYYTSQSSFCGGNCHTMTEQYEAW